MISKFLKATDYKINKNSILSYIEEISGLEKRRTHVNKVTEFLRYVATQKGFDVEPYIQLLNKVQAPKKEKKLYADENEDVYTLSLNDIHKTAEQILEIGKGGIKGVLRDLSCVIFLASTGIRVQEACGLTVQGIVDPGLTKDIINLDLDYFILPSELSKTHTRRIIPLHPDAKLILKAYWKYAKDELWNYDTVRKIIVKTELGQLERLRKFFTKMSKELGFDQIKRIAIQGHDEDELLKLRVTQDFYEKYTPSEICAEYFEKWSKVEILPKDVRDYISKFLSEG
jgi:integrase